MQHDRDAERAGGEDRRKARVGAHREKRVGTEGAQRAARGERGAGPREQGKRPARGRTRNAHRKHGGAARKAGSGALGFDGAAGKHHPDLVPAREEFGRDR